MMLWPLAYRCLLAYSFSVLWGISLRVELTESDGNSRLSFWETTVFPSGHTIVHSYQQCTMVPISSYPCQCFLFSGFDNNQSSGSKVISLCSFDYISLMTNDMECLFMILSSICMSCMEKCHVSPLPFLNWVFVVVVEM